MVGLFTPWELANPTDQGLSALESPFTSIPLFVKLAFLMIPLCCGLIPGTSKAGKGESEIVFPAKAACGSDFSRQVEVSSALARETATTDDLRMFLML